MRSSSTFPKYREQSPLPDFSHIQFDHRALQCGDETLLQQFQAALSRHTKPLLRRRRLVIVLLSHVSLVSMLEF